MYNPESLSHLWDQNAPTTWATRHWSNQSYICGTTHQLMWKNTQRIPKGLGYTAICSEMRFHYIIAVHSQKDDICQLLIQYCQEGWPDKYAIKGQLKYCMPVEMLVSWWSPDESCRIVIPASIRMQILEKLHKGHLCIVWCRTTANQSVCWLGIGRHLRLKTTLIPVRLQPSVPNYLQHVSQGKR